MALTDRIEGVAVAKEANIYFDGRCVSHTIFLADGSKKTLGVILPSTLVFNTQAAETMEGLSGSCRVRLKGEADWTTYGAGQSFNIPAHSSFEIVCAAPYHYLCHFLN